MEDSSEAKDGAPICDEGVAWVGDSIEGVAVEDEKEWPDVTAAGKDGDVEEEVSADVGDSERDEDDVAVPSGWAASSGEYETACSDMSNERTSRSVGRSST